ncbi:MAG: thioredoxin [Chitinophagales bacterium]|nr:thioredoxin [Bacteroidota bacterium]MCB9043580.1 thioredoxin [Chitinophagales bacterium]
MNFGELINKDEPVLIDFYADWCGPCKMMSPIIQELAKDFKGKATFVKIDVDKNPALAQSLHIQGIPTFIMYKNGKQVWRKSGAMPKQQFVEALNQNV